MSDSSFDAGEPKQVKKAKSAHRTTEIIQREELREMLQTKPGRAVLWRILSLCRLYRSSMMGEETNLMAFYEGHRNVGLKLITLIDEADPSAYARMRSENQET
jgi:hypothetical protein